MFFPSGFQSVTELYRKPWGEETYNHIKGSAQTALFEVNNVDTHIHYLLLYTYTKIITITHTVNPENFTSLPLPLFFPVSTVM